MGKFPYKHIFKTYKICVINNRNDKIYAYIIDIQLRLPLKSNKIEFFLIECLTRKMRNIKKNETNRGKIGKKEKKN